MGAGITAVRALNAAIEAMRENGLVPLDQVVEGWIQPNYMNSVGFGIRKLPTGGLEWNMRIDATDAVRWKASGMRDEDDDGYMDPVNDDELHPRVKAIYQGLGLDVTDVRTSGWGGYGDRDLMFTVTTAHPDWLSRYDKDNAPEESDRPLLVGFRATGRHGETRGPVLPGYLVDGAPFLTRESVEALAAMPREREGPTFALDGDEFKVGRGFRDPVAVMRAEVTNAWDDVVPVWKLPQGSFRATYLPDGTVPFRMSGEMRSTAPFALLDAQYELAPWTTAPTGPRP